MKKIIYALIGLFIIGCSSSDSITEYYINIQIDKIPQEYANQYNFADFKIAIYSSKEDYFNETNPIHVGNFDSSGKFSISKNITPNSYYIDIFTPDFVLSNWQPSDLNVDSSNIIVFLGNDVEDFYVPVGVNDQRAFVGEWNFMKYDGHYNHGSHDRTERSKLIINKDFSITSYEKYNSIDFTVTYLYANGIKHISTNPEPYENNYPYWGVDKTTGNGGLHNYDNIMLYFTPNTNKTTITFIDVADEWAMYYK